MATDLGIGGKRPVERGRVPEVEAPEVVDEVAAGQDQYALVAEGRELPAERVVMPAGLARVHAELDDRDVRRGVHRNQHAPGPVVEAAERVEADALARDERGDARGERRFPGRG